MTSLFTSLFEQVVFWVTLVPFFVIVLIFLVRHGRKEGKKRQDFFPLILLTPVVAIAVGYARIGVLPNWLFYLGEVLFVLGGAFTYWSYSILGRYLSPYVQALPEHKVIDSGPYRYIRHPGYLGVIVSNVGLSLALQSWVAVLANLAVAGSLLAHRIRNEEEFLGAELGDGYVSYMKRTKRLLPLIW